MISLPSLGPRGEGWVVVQFLLLGMIVLSGLLEPRAEGESAQLLGFVGLVCMPVGAAVLVRGLLDLGRNLTPVPRPRPDARLVVGGIYRLVRHPMYLGLLLTAAGWALATASPRTLALAVVLAIFFDLKARREEAWLRERYPTYDTYVARTRRLIPWLY